MFALAGVALLVSGYLTVTALVAGLAPAGCGAGSGCAAVLSTKWSRWWGLPVSGAAVLTYAAVLAALVLTGARAPGRQRAGWVVLLGAATVVSGAAAWFIYVQWVVIGALCVYCMVDHVCGLLLAGLVFGQRPWRRRVAGPSRLPRALAGAAVAAGAVGVVALIVVQLNSAAVVRRLPAIATDRDFDLIEAGVRRVGLLGGQLQLVAEDEPLLGPPRGKHVLAMMLDYACPHCRHAHELLLDLKQQRYAGDLTVIALIVPMNRDCNEHAPEEMPKRFEHSCELARLVLAVFLADPTQFAPFDRWMYEPKEPPDPEAARAEAERLVGKTELARALADPRLEEMLDRNLEAYGDSGADRVPVILAPGAPSIVGRVEEAESLVALLEGRVEGELDDE